MSKPPVKLVTWKQWIVALAAVGVGACMSLYREYRDTGGITNGSIVLSGVVFLIGVVIVTVVFRYANRLLAEDDE